MSETDQNRPGHDEGVPIAAANHTAGQRPSATYVSPFAAGLKRRCPRCGVGALFAGFLQTRESCQSCGLSYAFADAGDGPAVFVMLIVGFIVCGAALWLEVKHEPPFWVHAVLWVPLILGLAGFLLPVLKAVLVALQYQNKAAAGRLDRS